MIRLPEIKTAELSTYRNFAKCHQAHFRVSRVGLGTRLPIELQPVQLQSLAVIVPDHVAHYASSSCHVMLPT